MGSTARCVCKEAYGSEGDGEQAFQDPLYPAEFVCLLSTSWQWIAASCVSSDLPKDLLEIVKWPSDRKKVSPCTVPEQSLEEAFTWPQKAMAKLSVLLPEIFKHGKPLLAEKRTLKVVSNFSGVCSQTRAMMALQARPEFPLSFDHAEGLDFLYLLQLASFECILVGFCIGRCFVRCSVPQQSILVMPPSYEVAFTELVKQGQQTLCRDFPNACVFKNQMDVLSPDSFCTLVGSLGFEDVLANVRSASFASQAPCVQHKQQCPLPKQVDLAVFGSPCTDDSSQGSQKKDDGQTRKEPH